MPVGVTTGNVPVLPVLLPWQHAQVPHSIPFDAHHNAENLHNISSKKASKKEPWFKKFKYRYMCISFSYYICMLLVFRPLSENRAAIIIQKHCRGYLTRRNLEFQQYLANRWLAGRLVDKIIDDVLLNDILPDVLIELLHERISCGGLVCYQTLLVWCVVTILNINT